MKIQKSKEFDYIREGIQRIKCPKCGELGTPINLKNGSKEIRHKAIITQIIIPVCEITKSCFI